MSQLKPAADPRQHILDAAAGVFAREGYAGARVDDIARRAAVNKAMLYYHVGDKDALYAAVFADVLAEAKKRLENAASTTVGAERRFRNVVRAMARMADEHPHFAPLMLRAIASGGADLPDSIVGQMRAVFHVLAEVLAEGVQTKAFRNVDPYLTHMFIGGSLLVLISGAPIRRRVRGEVAPADRVPEDMADYVSELLLGGLCQPAPRRGKEAASRRTTSPSRRVRS